MIPWQSAGRSLSARSPVPSGCFLRGRRRSPGTARGRPQASRATPPSPQGSPGRAAELRGATASNALPWAGQESWRPQEREALHATINSLRQEVTVWRDIAQPCADVAGVPEQADREPHASPRWPKLPASRGPAGTEPGGGRLTRAGAAEREAGRCVRELGPS